MERQYEQQAESFLTEHGLSIRMAFKGDRCPPWETGLCTHGDRYRITIKRVTGTSISFDFWNSQADMQTNKRPTAYDVLTCISSDAFSPTDPDEVAEEFGNMRPSQAIAIARFATKLQAFFDEEELEALSEIN